MKSSSISPYRIERYRESVLHSVIHFDDLDTAKLALIPMWGVAHRLSMYLVDSAGEVIEYINSTKDSKRAVDKNIKREKESK